MFEADLSDHEKLSHSVSNDENQASSSALVSDSLHSQSTTKKASFSTPKDSESIGKRSPHFLHESIIKEWQKILNIQKNEDVKRLVKEMSIEDLMAKDENGDTRLTRLLSDPEEFMNEKEYLMPLVERLKTEPGGLEVENNNGESPVYLAVLNFPTMPQVFGYLAGEMMFQGNNFNKTIDCAGNTLLHCIATNGDIHSDVLKLMLDLLIHTPFYDISCRNYNDESPLHLAIKYHHVSPLGATVTIQLLLEHGAKLSQRIMLTGDTSLHLALLTQFDVHLFEVLLRNTDVETVNKRNFLGYSPLHLAAALFCGEDVEGQVKICKLLINAGALTHLENAIGEKPIDLVLQESKEILKKILDTE